MDKIFLYGMKADTLIGVYDWERERKQTLILDLEISVPELYRHERRYRRYHPLWRSIRSRTPQPCRTGFLTAGNVGGTYRPIDFK